MHAFGYRKRVKYVKRYEFNLGASQSTIAAIAIGDEYYDAWHKFVRPSWERYASTYDVAIVVYREDMVAKTSPYWKPAAWQKLLLPHRVKADFPDIVNCLVLDLDVVAGPLAKNIS
mgnify:CR=1 FL=1